MDVVPFARIQELVKLESVIEPVREAFKSYSLRTATIPPVQHLELPDCEDGALHIKSGYVADHAFCVVKVASTFPANTRQTPPRPSIDGLIAIFSASDGRALVILDDRAWITQMRTAGAGAVAVSLLARPGAETLGVIGTGAQARLQVSAALHAQPSLRRVLIWGRTPAHAVSCAEDLRCQWPRAPIQVAASREQVAREADVLVTATYSTEPLVYGDWLREGTLVIAMGADSARKRELDSEAFLYADRVVVDSRSQNEILGEIGHGIREKHFTAVRMDAEIGEVILEEERMASEQGTSARDHGHGSSLGRTSPGERIICKLTGVAVQEIFVCAIVLEALGLGGKRTPAARRMPAPA